MSAVARRTPVRTGIQGLDEILDGGLPPDRLYLVEGVPGTGKTTLALQFLLEGVRLGERVLYVTLSETRIELEEIAQSHGWQLDGITVREVIPGEAALHPDEQYTVFHPSEVELSEATRSILGEVERVRPARVVFDSLSELRLLAGSPLRYRRQVLALKQFFAGRACTVMVLDDRTDAQLDLQVQSIAHGVILLDHVNSDYGAERRRLRVLKIRGVPFRGGYHDFMIRQGGLQVFPRISGGASEPTRHTAQFKTGVDELDDLLGGGLECGTSTLIAGGAGSGKSSIACQIAAAAADRGQKAAIFLFEESVSTLLNRCASLKIPLEKHFEAGRIQVQKVDPAELSPGEFAHEVCGAAADGAKVIVIDSLNGYMHAMPQERFLTVQLHELLTHLNHAGVVTVMVAVNPGVIANETEGTVDVSYLADCVILLRYFEAQGEVRQALSILKKRGGAHERTIREFKLNGSGVRVGEPLREFHGILTGVPTYTGNTEPLLPDRAEDAEDARA